MFRETAKHFTTHIIHKQTSWNFSTTPPFVHGPLSPLHYPLWPFVPSSTLCPLCNSISLHGPLSPLWLLSPLQPSVCPLHGPLPYVPLRHLCGPLFCSTALCPFYDPLSPVRPSVLSTAVNVFAKPFASKNRRPANHSPCFAGNSFWSGQYRQTDRFRLNTRWWINKIKQIKKFSPAPQN